MLLLLPAHIATCRFIGNPSFVLISSLATLSPTSSGAAPDPQPSNFTRVIPEIDIWRAANLMLKRYGGKALEESAAGADELAAQEDRNGEAVWCRITDAVGQLAKRDNARVLH